MLSFRCIFLAMLVTMAMSRLTGCQGKELRSQKCSKKTTEDCFIKCTGHFFSAAFVMNLKVEESLY